MSASGKSAPAAAPADSDRIDPVVRRLALTVIVGALAAVFDTTIVSVAINDLARDLDAPLSTIQWVSTGYLLAMFVTIPIVGWAQAAVGGKRLWLGSLGFFLLGSVLCAAAWDAPSLIVFRIVQGVAAGIMMPLMSTLIMQAVRGRNIGRVMATISLPVALGPILGPVLGGLLLATGNWRLLFGVNILFCAVGGWLAFRNLPDDRPVGERGRLDAVGLLLLSPGAAALIYGLSQIPVTSGLGSPRVLVPLVAGLVLVVGFVGWALRRGSAALVNVRLLSHRSLAASSALLFLVGVTLYGAMLLLPLYWQQARGEDALGAGLLLIPQGIGSLLSRPLAGRWTDRVGPRWIAFAGFCIVGLATVPFAVAPDSPYPLLMAVLVVRGLGLGIATIPLASAAYLGMDHRDIPNASIIVLVTQQIGGSFGTAVLAMILQHAGSGARSPEALTQAFGTTFWWSVGFTVLAVPLCLLLPGRPKPLTDSEQSPAEVPAAA
ncbi:MDR family MFS transporter [Micromonospora sp. WMMD987]|uniref:MDR family MFS transporter n=1 Tax=Micromonospora sp. WMMD987 TaxID=3016089 RepID=UPI00249AD94A|nr:MDR family MFS transporter [Micromonospora sp. WMMD987]WFE93444.1 MDR family MFS transporter [Micromonospora sp. WMMD987]